MFVRRKKNKNGSVSVQIISKTRGAYRVVKSVGSSDDLAIVERLVAEAYACMEQGRRQNRLFPILTPESAAIHGFVHTLKNSAVRTVGPELIFGTLFDRIGFDEIPGTLFRHLVVARLVHPTSKLKTVDYLERYRGLTIDVSTVYRFLDTLTTKHKVTAERIAYEYTKKTLGTILVVFYDMTTLYFEAEDEDDLRKIGFSKDGKFQCPQIMVGLLVGEGGYPIGYDIFEGNTFEGHTLVKTLNNIGGRYGLGKPVVVADAAMLSKDNISALTKAGYTFIVGGRVKNESKKTKAEILERAKGSADGVSFEVPREDGTRLIVTFSEKRRKKDAHNREKGVKKLRAKVTSGKLTKTHITNRGYNKFLTLAGDVSVAIDDVKIDRDTKWDGLKGYVTNTALSRENVVEHYGHLWQIEKAFRISKTDLRVRPIFHYKRRRIEAHLTIVFVAYCIWKELERLLKQKGAKMSPARAAALTHTMYEIEYTLPHTAGSDRAILEMEDEQQLLYDVIHRK